ncbi:putative uncharacterized protein [Sutterella sp. CAG:521]|nr:putative uncharacterized protein [Sutterella sp. CAG:521]
MRYAPPQKIALSKQIKKSLIASSLILAINSTYAADDFIYKPGISNYEEDINRVLNINKDSTIPTEYENIDIELAPPIANDRYTVSVNDGCNLKVNGSTQINLHAYMPDQQDDDSGSNALFAVGISGSESEDPKISKIDLLGDVAINITHPFSEDTSKTVGANGVYAREFAEINLGSVGTTTKIQTIALKPDAISAKNGGKVYLNSLNNQIVGSIDFIYYGMGTKNSVVQGTFSGDTSYWFGDDQSVMNAEVNYGGTTYSGKNGFEAVYTLLNFAMIFFPEDNELHQMAKKIWDKLQLEGTKINDVFDLTFQNGAQWTYFGLSEQWEGGSDLGDTALQTIPKRISSIRLKNGGIVNLFDQNIRETWQQIGLADAWPELMTVNHDYVRIGDLKGSNGIFRLDLNSDDPSQSDIVFIESSSEPGQHFIEPYRPEDLTSVSDTNRLTFALTAEGANSVTFADKQNIYGNSLFDYELIIDYERIDETNQELINKITGLVGNYETFDDFDITDYYNGTHWYIKRLLTKESAASIGMRSAGYASYDLAVNMDRRDRRLQNAVFQNEEKDGLWARVQYGEAGAEHLYNADLTTVYVGYEKATSADNRLGFSFAYTDGESDLNDLKGSGDLKRYEASVYDTLTFGSHYLDFVARFGQVDNEFDVTNQSGALTTSGSFDQKYAALSAEYGYNFKDEHNVFIEPQVQLQVAYLGDYNYRTERNMKVDADSDISVIGRVGLRTGKTFESSDYVGELYARADVLHQFTDGQDAQFSDLSDKVNVTWGNKDTWSTFGVGGYLNWKDNMSFQVDVERTAGGETIDTWLVSGRVNYLF